MKFQKIPIVTFLVILLSACGPIDTIEESSNTTLQSSSTSTAISFASYDNAFVSDMMEWADASTTVLLEQLNSPGSFSIEELRYVFLKFTDNTGSWEAYYFLFNFTSDGNAGQLALGFVSIFEGETEGAFVFLSTDEIMYESLSDTFESLFEYSGTTEEIELYNLIYGSGFDIRRGILSRTQINTLLT